MKLKSPHGGECLKGNTHDESHSLGVKGCRGWRLFRMKKVVYFIMFAGMKLVSGVSSRQKFQECTRLMGNIGLNPKHWEQMVDSDYLVLINMIDLWSSMRLHG